MSKYVETLRRRELAEEDICFIEYAWFCSLAYPEVH
jgi:hypothetical protein